MCRPGSSRKNEIAGSPLKHPGKNQRRPPIELRLPQLFEAGFAL
jgi:hypothetical protein